MPFKPITNVFLLIYNNGEDCIHHLLIFKVIRKNWKEKIKICSDFHPESLNWRELELLEVLTNTLQYVMEKIGYTY